MRTVIYKHNRGFTLLEMMLSIAVFVLLATTAFALVGATTELMSEVAEVQNDSAIEIRFLETVRSAFEELTSESTIEFEFYDRGSGSYDTYFCMIGAPQAFNFGANLSEEITAVVIAAEIQPDGFIRSGVYYLNELNFALAKEKEFTALRETPYVELIPRMRQLSWRFYNARNDEWQPTLDPEGSSLVELVIQLGNSTVPLRTVLWHAKE